MLIRKVWKPRKPVVGLPQVIIIGGRGVTRNWTSVIDLVTALSMDPRWAYTSWIDLLINS